MKIISGSEVTERAQEMLDTIASIILQLEGMNNDLEHEFGDEILTKKIGKGVKDGACKYSLRDRYGELFVTDYLIQVCQLLRAWVLMKRNLDWQLMK